MDVGTGTSPLEAHVERLDSRLAALERRLAALEAKQGSHPVVAVHGAEMALSQPAPGAANAGSLPDMGALATLFGRTLVVLAGAFLLRALVESGRLDSRLGLLFGMTFALTWIAMASRVGGRGQQASASFHGLAFVLIAFPLLFEATNRFHFLTATTSALALTAGTAIALAVSFRHRLRGLAWLTLVAGLIMAPTLAITTAELGPFTLFLILLGVGTLWLGYVLEWRLLRWPAALWADAAVLVLSFRAVVPAAPDAPATAFAAQALVLAGYLGSFAMRTLLLNRNVVPFEIAQSITAGIAGLGGAAYLTHRLGGGLWLGVATLTLAVGCYAAAAIFVARFQDRRRNYYFYTTAGLVLALAGCAFAMPRSAIGPVCGALGVVAAWAGRFSSRVTYRAHGAVLIMAAVIVTGLTHCVLYGLGWPFVTDGRTTLPGISVLVFCGIAMWGLTPDDASAVSPFARHAPRLLVLVLLLGGILGTVVTVIAPPSDGVTMTASGFTATLRTALLVAAILVLALASRVWAFTEGAWLVYPLLMLTGLKFLLEDFRIGQPTTLFVSFALYGVGLIAGPRLARRRAASDGPVDQRS